MFHQTVAERFGLGATDSRAWSILDETGPITAGELAERTGLTTGAVTGIIDRLEEAGWVRRDADPGDRRKVIVRPLRHPERERRARALFASLHRGFGRVAGGYRDDELALILEFITSCTDLLWEETRKLRRSDPGPAPKR